MSAAALHEIPYPTQDPLRPSYASLALSGLMLFAMQAAGAGGCSWCELDRATGALVERHSSGIAVPRWEKLHGAEDALEGMLAFVFRRIAIQEKDMAILLANGAAGSEGVGHRVAAGLPRDDRETGVCAFALSKQNHAPAFGRSGTADY
jgi:hypothetical protein